MTWYLKCNIGCYCLQLDNAIIYFTPSGMLIYQNNWHVTYKSYGTLALGFDFTNFISDVITVSDAKIVGKTWKYANINGEADKRFNNNKINSKISYQHNDNLDSLEGRNQFNFTAGNFSYCDTKLIEELVIKTNELGEHQYAIRKSRKL